VLRLVIGEALLLALAGVAIGLAGALVSTRVMASQLYGVSARDPVTLASASALLLVVAVLAACVPALNALSVDPVVALKNEGSRSL